MIERRWIGVLEQVLGDLAGAAADVENVLDAAKVESALAQQLVAQVNVQRQQAGRGQKRALRTAVDVAHLVAILLVADPIDQVVFDELENLATAARTVGWLAGWAGQQRLADHS